MPTLTIQLPGLPPVAHLLKDETITVGRMKGNTIVIDDVSVSLSHARITRKNGEFILKDLNSTNGTLVNGQQIVEARLRDQDRLRFADISGQFLVDVPEVASAVVAPQTIPQPVGVVVAPQVAALPAATAVASKSVLAAPKSSSRSRRTGSGFSQLLNTVVPIIGAAAAVGVFSVIGWRMLHLGHEGADDGVRPGSSSSLVATEPVETGSPTQVTVPSQSRNTVPPSNETVDIAPVSVAQLIAALKSDDPIQRRQAATALHALGPEAMDAVPALRVALSDTDQEVRMWAAVTLVNDKCYDKATIPILLGILRQDDPVLRQVACLSLALIPYEPAEKETVVPLLAETAGKDTSEEVRKAAVTALNILAPDALAKAGVK